MFNNPYPNPWGGWGSQPVVFIPPPNTPPPNNPQPQFSSWHEVQKHAKMMAKKEFKLKEKWEKEAKIKKDKESANQVKKPMIPLAEGLFLAVLLSPFIGLPTLKIYQIIFQMWGSALGMK